MGGGENSVDWVPPDTFWNLCYNNQFKLYAASKMEPFMIKKTNGWKLLLAVVT